jgi:hypothetical protein
MRYLVGFVLVLALVASPQSGAVTRMAFPIPSIRGAFATNTVMTAMRAPSISASSRPQMGSASTGRSNAKATGTRIAHRNRPTTATRTLAWWSAPGTLIRSMASLAAFRRDSVVRTHVPRFFAAGPAASVGAIVSTVPALTTTATLTTAPAVMPRRRAKLGTPSAFAGRATARCSIARASVPGPFAGSLATTARVSAGGGTRGASMRIPVQEALRAGPAERSTTEPPTDATAAAASSI